MNLFCIVSEVASIAKILSYQQILHTGGTVIILINFILYELLLVSRVVHKILMGFSPVFILVSIMQGFLWAGRVTQSKIFAQILN